MGGRGTTKWEGGGGWASEVLPLQRKSCSHVEGGTTNFEVVLTREFKVLAILGGGGGGCSTL